MPAGTQPGQAVGPVGSAGNDSAFATEAIAEEGITGDSGTVGMGEGGFLGRRGAWEGPGEA